MKHSGEYTVKGVTSMETYDGRATTCTLYRGDTAVAKFQDLGQGGECEFFWLDHKAPRVASEVRGFDGKPRSVSMTPEEAGFNDYCRGRMYPPTDGFPDGLEMGMDGVVLRLCDAYETRARLRRRYAKSVGFRRKGEAYAPDTWSVIKAVYSPEVRARIEAKYGPCVFLNEIIAWDDLMAMDEALSE